MENNLINLVLSYYAGWTTALSKQLGINIMIIKLAAVIIIALLALALCYIVCGKRCFCHLFGCLSTTVKSKDINEKISDINSASDSVPNPAQFNQQNIALAEAYLDMQDPSKARECLSQIHAAALTAEELNKVQQLQKRLEK